MAEKRIGTLSLSCGADAVRRLPFSSRSTRSVLRPRKVRVSMGSRRGSMGGFVTCEALSSRRSQ